MIDASRSVDKPTENVKVPFDEYNKLSSISTKVDIIVDLMCHGTLMADDVLRILKVDTNFPKETTFEKDIVVSVCIYNNLLELKVRVDVLLDMLEKKDYVSTDEILRTLGTELAIEEADRWEKEINERFNNKQ
jgi:hypothetical protein|nr:MAG TPA: hypothetical protein [Bacteriophage sp.]